MLLPKRSAALLCLLPPLLGVFGGELRVFFRTLGCMVSKGILLSEG